MLIRVLAAALCCALAAPGQAADLQKDQSGVEKTKKAKAPKPKDQSNPKAPKQKKPKKAKSDVPAPDEPIDPDAVETGGSGWRFSWKQHPSLRYGSIFRMDGEAKFQEIGRAHV